MVRYCREPDRVRVVITDEGQVRLAAVPDMDPARAFDTHGRGIAMSRMISFDAIEFHGRATRSRSQSISM